MSLAPVLLLIVAQLAAIFVLVYFYINTFNLI